MKNRFTFILITILFIASYKSIGQNKIPQSSDTVKTIQNELSQTEAEEFDTTEIICDSIYRYPLHEPRHYLFNRAA